MAVIYLTHPVFGDKVANSDLEVEYDLRNGWSRSAPAAPADAAPPDGTPAEIAEVINLLAAARIVRRRRAPVQEG
jgi:hypothetical protein